MTAEINVQHIGKSFKGFTALDDVSFSVQKGEIFGFLGPSGSGKTTLIKILTAQLDHNKGKASVFGIPVHEMKRADHKSRFGLLTDNSGLYKRLSVEENLSLYKDLYKLPDHAIDEALAFVNLRDARKKKVSKLSKGMIQRVTLARALMHKPELLFLDEPTSALDPGNTHHIYKGLRKLNEMGTTIFLTTHDMAEAETLCNRVAFLHEGKIKAIGTPSELRLRHSDQSMVVELTSGEQHTLPLNELTTAGKLEEWMRNQLIQRIWSNEPTLGDIFMEITGRDLR
ncbi:ABC transporter ATP-binding protein [Jeotgalibacillus terrae]|uniref:ABC transporter ATP-binding protein n=1 Tax=Jeotgalibacillus terrae TaxID=587735 RepID=A0ABW5ZJN8_9BACL|nr:ABC transporter ATP-binding protein [Jeotgalibacillus terrae]MBM7578673.1 ABC-2 type transport system ATP-binding protein [Jeotgalibacillus terrae]